MMVSEMSRAQALRVAQSLNALIGVDGLQADFMQTELDTLYVLNAPALVTLDGKVLDAGSYPLQMGDTNFTLELPLTRACFDALPVSLAAEWIAAAQRENEWLSDFFVKALRRTIQSISVPTSDSAAS